MDTFSVQLTLLACLFFGNFLFGNLPSLIIKIAGCFGDAEDACFRKIKVATLMLYVGAGVFISNSFLDLLPGANKEFANSDHHSHKHTNNSETGSPEHSEHHHHHFPMPEFLILCGFFFAYVLQEAIFFLLTKFQRIQTDATDIRVRRFCTCAKRHTECSRTFKDARPDQTLFGREKNLTESGYIANPTNAATNIPQETEAAAKSDLLRSSILAQAVPNYGTVTNVTEPVIDNPLPVLTPPVLLNDERRIVMEQQNEAKHQKRFLINSMLIASALALQYVFFGIHLGLRTEHFKRWFYLSVTCLQSMLLTFSFGSYLAGNMDQSCILLFIGLLSAVSPIGLIIAVFEKEAVGEISHLAKGIVFAVACGTLLYTTFYEMLRQKNLSAVGLTKFTAIIVGASVMALLQYGTLHL